MDTALDSIMRNPVMLINTPSMKINYGAQYTQDKNVMLQISAGGAQEMMISNSPDCETNGTWEAFSENKPWVLGAENSSTLVYAKFRKSGVPETECIKASIIHDNIAPQLVVNQKAPAYTNLNSVTVTFAATDSGSGVEGVYCKSANSADMKCVDSFTFGALAQEGTYSVSIFAADAAGNTSAPATETLVVDRTPPVLTINGPQGLTGQTNPSFTFSVVDGNGVSAVQCRLMGVEAALKDCSSMRADYANLATGSYKMELVATDKAGNRAEKSQSFEVDASVPSVTLTKTPLALGKIKDASFEFTGVSGTNAITQFKCALDGAALATCSSPSNYANLGDKSYNFQVIGINNVGKESAPAQYTFVVDTTPPAVSIVSSPTGTIKVSSASVVVNATDANGIKSIQCVLNGAATDCSNRQANYTALADGNYTFKAIAVDNAGNVAETSTVSWKIDTTPDSNILATMAQNPVKEGTNGTLNITLTSVTNAAYNCVVTSSKAAVKSGNITGNSASVNFIVNEDITCEVAGLDKNNAAIKRTVLADVNCGNRIKVNGKCEDFKCKSVITLPLTNNLVLPARTNDGICYAMKLFNEIANSPSELTGVFDNDLIARDHTTTASNNSGKLAVPYKMGQHLMNIKLAGPRTAILSGAADTKTNILVDNFVLAGLYPLAATPLPVHYLAQGTKDSSASLDDNDLHILMKNAKVKLKPFGGGGTSTLAPITIMTEADTDLDYVMDVRAIDCRGARQLSNIYIVFQ